MLMVTHGCNLNCIYCYEKFKNGSKQMSIELAKEIVSREINFVENSEEFDELEVDFMGGEPLLRFDLIRAIVEWLEHEGCKVPYICFATTNGTLLNDEMKAWFREHRQSMVLGASYDGIGNAQSMNRGEKADTLDLNFFYETWPFQGFKMTLSKESLPHLYESMVYVARKGYPMDASLAHGVDWDVNDADIYYEQLMKLGDFYLENKMFVPCNLLLRPLHMVGERTPQQPKFCGSGTHMATYDVDGTKYGCHMFTPLVLGGKAMRHVDFHDWENEEMLTDPECVGCGFARWCSTCIGFNMLDRGQVNKRDHRWCAMNAAQATAACDFQLRYFLQLDASIKMREQEASVLQAALEAYPYLSSLNFHSSFPQ